MEGDELENGEIMFKKPDFDSTDVRHSVYLSLLACSKQKRKMPNLGFLTLSANPYLQF